MLENLRGRGITVDEMQLPAYSTVDQSKYDVLIYNTFPDESSRKFLERNGNHSALIKICDEKFYAFKGKRMLFDTHDNGTKDGFERLNDTDTFRIKVNPGLKVMERMQILPIPYVVYRPYNNPSEDRTVPIMCAMKILGFPITRRKILEKITKFHPTIAWLPLKEHAARLCHTRINIVLPGWGDSSLSHTDTLAAGALLFAHESVENVRILPYAELKDGVNYVSYNLSNIVRKLSAAIKAHKKADEIRKAGLEAFRTGYDVNRSADDLLKVIG